MRTAANRWSGTCFPSPLSLGTRVQGVREYGTLCRNANSGHFYRSGSHEGKARIAKETEKATGRLRKPHQVRDGLSNPLGSLLDLAVAEMGVAQRHADIGMAEQP